MNIHKYTIDVTIIIVSYNGFKMLDDCIKSVYEHTKDISFEIIVVDNNSAEGDVEDVTNKFPEVILIKNDENKGFAAANNQGIEIAKGKYSLLLNNDTLLLENSIKKTFDFAENLNFDAVIGIKLLNEDKTLQLSTYAFTTLLNTFSNNFFINRIFKTNPKLNKFHLHNGNISETTETDVVIGAYFFSKTETFLQLNGLDDRFFFYNEEADFCYRLKQQGGKVFYYPETSIIHFGGAIANKYPWFKEKMKSFSQIQFFQKHFSTLRFLTAIFIHYLGIFLRIPLFFLSGLATLKKSLILRAGQYCKLLFVYPKNKFK